MKRLVLLIFAAGLLAGCAHNTMSDDETCQSYGLVPGTDGYVQCREQIGMQRQQFQDNMLMGYALTR